MQIPSYTIFTGPMFGGKTTKLLAKIDRLKFQKKNVCLFKPVMDNRYDMNAIVSHSGASHEAIQVSCGTDILSSIINDIEKIDVIAVDEAFMIPGCAAALDYVFSLGKSIFVSTLDLSASCSAFEEVALMMPHATHIIKCPAVCTECGADAFYTECKVQMDKDIMVGGSDVFHAVCFHHHSQLSKKYASGVTSI